jgi:hypothetical protein
MHVHCLRVCKVALSRGIGHSTSYFRCTAIGEPLKERMIVTEGSLPCRPNVRPATAFFFRSAY